MEVVEVAATMLDLSSPVSDASNLAIMPQTAPQGNRSAEYMFLRNVEFDL
jgi:hypothetical protein